MTYLRPTAWPIALTGYVVGGLAIGAALPAMKSFAAAHWGRAGLAVAFVVNIAMPLLVVIVAAAYPHRWLALAGTLAASIGFVLVGSRSMPAFSATWLAGTLRSLPPVLVVAIIAYHAIAVITTYAVSPWRCVGIPPDPRACQTCGYLLVGVTSPRCPECGTDIPAERTRRPSG